VKILQFRTRNCFAVWRVGREWREGGEVVILPSLV
jgi:hypothetical protein